MNTSWEQANEWYGALVGEKGHYYHKHVIFPHLLPLLDLSPEASVLDVGCGQGILARVLPKEIHYQGLDLSPSLIKAAKEKKKARQSFSVADITKPLPLKGTTFTQATCILALQNVSQPEKALKNVAKHLVKGGAFFLVLNHPCFRIPRQSHWEIDTEKKVQYRRVDRYLSPLKIPIQMHPGKGKRSVTTWSFHHPLNDLSRYLREAGFLIERIDEWTSDKKSTGKAAKMENRARTEFPLFLAIKAQKV